MTRAFRRNLLVLTALLLTVPFAACVNPFDPLSTTDAIRGLSFVDYSLTWDRWDSDPAGDGVVVTVEYFNEFSDSLSFNDKPHRVVIEFYTERKVNPDVDEVTGETQENTGTPTFDELFFTFPVEHQNSDNDILIPIEAYQAAMVGVGYDLSEDAEAFVNVRVFPPQQDPQPELVVFYSGQTIYEPEPTAATEDELIGVGEPELPAAPCCTRRGDDG